MKVEYLGHSCFLISGSKSLVFDPFNNIGYDLKNVSCDYVFCSHDHFDHNAKSLVNYQKCFDMKNVDDVASGIKIERLMTNHDDSNGSKRGKNIVFKITMDGFTIVHLGDLGEVTKSTLEYVCGADMLFVPVGGNYTIDSEKALQIINDTKPKFVFPMHYGIKRSNIDIAPLGDFLVANDNRVVVFSDSVDIDKEKTEETTICVFDKFL